MMIREPIVAGRFYPQQADRCQQELEELLPMRASDRVSERPLFGGLVPHAGWVCSGAVAARVFCALQAEGSPDVIVLFGAVHRSRARTAAQFGAGRWNTPLGPVEVDQRLAERILGHTNAIVEDAYAHEQEHSIEVQMPFIKHLFPKAKVVPIMVPVTERAHEIGDAVARTIQAYSYNAAIIGTTDLTHYGPAYNFTPRGVGAKGILWAKEENDRRFLDLVTGLEERKVVAESLEHRNACGGGATAATLAAMKVLGAKHGVILEHTSSSEVLGGLEGADPVDSVGYAGVVFE